MWGSANLATNPCSLYINLPHPRFFHVSGARLGGCVWGRPLATRHARAYGLVTVFEKTDFQRFYCCAGCAWACVGRPVKKAGRVCATVELEVGARGCCPGQMGEKHWSARAVHTLEKGHCQSATRNTTTSRGGDSGPQRKWIGCVTLAATCRYPHKGRECCSSTAGQAPAGQGTAERASGTRSLSPCLEQLQHAIATRGVSPLSQLRRCVRGAARCCVEDSSSFDGEGRRSMAPAQPRQVPLPSHALSMTAKTAVACNVVGAQLVPAHRPAGVRLIGPFLQVHVVSIAWQLAAAPDTAQGPTPAFSLPLDTCLKIHLRHPG